MNFLLAFVFWIPPITERLPSPRESVPIFPRIPSYQECEEAIFWNNLAQERFKSCAIYDPNNFLRWDRALRESEYLREVWFDLMKMSHMRLEGDDTSKVEMRLIDNIGGYNYFSSNFPFPVPLWTLFED